MAVKIAQRSRLNFASYVKYDGVEFWDAPNYPTIPVSSTDIRYTVSNVDRIDLLANKFYGDPSLWWVIALANDLELIPTDLYPGLEIVIPSPQWVTQKLFSKTG
jgi:nucleoid-associated protein YgaU